MCLLWRSQDRVTVEKKVQKILYNWNRQKIGTNICCDLFLCSPEWQVARTQCPLRPAGASTTHAGQGSTFNQVCIDMDISDSAGFQKYPNLAKVYLQHAHYVAASHVTSLEGLQILTWNPQLISTNYEVKEHLAFMNEQHMLRLCYVPVYNMPVGLKCLFLNTSSLHKNILHVKASHNICATEIILLAETRLIPNENTNEYLIPQYEFPYWNDQILDTPTKPSYGMISYIRTPVRVLAKYKPFYYVYNIQYYPYWYRW